MRRRIRWPVAAGAVLAGSAAAACVSTSSAPRAGSDATAAPAAPVAQPASDPREAAARARANMVDEQIAARGIGDARVLAAMRKVPRHEFVAAELAGYAYEDHAMTIGEGQTISQPYIVALMTELAELGPKSRVLEIGTGSGYQAAILAEVAGEVYSIEIVEPLARRAAATLERLGYTRVHLRIGDGYVGWPEAAPFDAIIVTAAPPRVPEPLRRQLRVGGRLVVPVGEQNREQQLMVITRIAEERWRDQRVTPVAFVPMTGAVQAPAPEPAPAAAPH